MQFAGPFNPLVSDDVNCGSLCNPLIAGGIASFDVFPAMTVSAIRTRSGEDYVSSAKRNPVPRRVYDYVSAARNNLSLK